MNHIKQISFYISLILGSSLLMAASAQADDTTTAPSASTTTTTTSTSDDQSPEQKKAKEQQSAELGTVNVSGIRGSLAASLQTKRSADAIVDAVTATDLNKFPTTNVADALSLIPGVTLDHVMPATERVSIDGLDPSLNVSLVDGHPVAQAMWLFGDSPNRGFNFSLLPSELVGKLEVYKSPEARLPEGSLGGVIIMHTLQPLDLKPNAMAGTLGYNYSQIVSEGKPTASGFYSFKNDEGTLGFDISAQHYEQVVSRQGMENYGYTTVAGMAANAVANAANPTNPLPNNGYIQGQIASGKLNPNDLVPNELSAANFNQVERRNGAFSNIQYRKDNFESTVSLMYMVDDLANTNQSTYGFAGADPGGITSLGNPVNGILTTGSASGTPLIGDTAGAGGKTAITYSDNFARASNITTEGVDWRTKYSGYDWNVSTQLGVSDSTNQITQVLKEIAYEGSYSWDLARGDTFTDPATANNPANWADHGWGGNSSLLPYAARDTYGQVDFTKDLDGLFNDVMAGVRYAGHWESQANYNYGGFPTKTLDQIGFGGLTDLTGLSDLGLSSSMIAHVQTCGFNCIANANPVTASPNYPNNPDANVYFNNTWNVVQEDTAGYVQGDFSSGTNMHGNIGARIVQTKITSQGFNVPGNCAANDTLNCSFTNGFGWLTYSTTHTNVLPAANIAFDMSQDVVLRGALSETIAFAPYNQLAPYFEANDTVLTAAAGNPNLNPYKSWNLDGSAEWYFTDQSALAGSVFYKDVRNYIVNVATTVDHINGSWTLPGYVRPANCDAATEVCPYSVTQPVDGGTATVKGFAVSYQQAFANTGFGVRANYTYSDATTSSGTGLPYNSKNSYALAPYYEQGPFSVSLSYNWRSSYLAGGYVAGAPPASVASYGELGASASWNITDMLSLNLSAMNINNETYRQYNGNQTELAEEYKTGAEYLLSLGFKL
jgi:iron complex outermembrane receptor protein